MIACGLAASAGVNPAESIIRGFASISIVNLDVVTLQAALSSWMVVASLLVSLDHNCIRASRGGGGGILP